MSDHDGHTINVGPVTVGEIVTVQPMTAPTPGVVARDAGPSEWSSRALTRRLADYLVNAYTDGRGYDPTDLDDVEVTLRDGFDIVLGEMHEAQRDRSDGGGSEDSTTASECPATAEPPSAPVTAAAAKVQEAGS